MTSLTSEEIAEIRQRHLAESEHPWITRSVLTLLLSSPFGILPVIFNTEGAETIDAYETMPTMYLHFIGAVYICWCGQRMLTINKNLDRDYDESRMYFIGAICFVVFSDSPSGVKFVSLFLSAGIIYSLTKLANRYFASRKMIKKR